MADLITTLEQTKMCDTLLQGFKVVGVEDLLRGGETLTLFAPVDAAFAHLPAGALDRLWADPPRLRKILLYHLVFGDVRSDDLLQIDEAPTVEGSVLAIATSQGYQVNQANILTPDLIADNGAIHVIDSVLMPALISA